MTQDHDSLLPQTDGLSNSAVDQLPEEIVARILGLLQPCQLHWVERVNTRLRNIVVHNNLWREHCKKVCHNFEAVVAAVDAESLRQVLVGLRALADADTRCNDTSNNTPSCLVSSVPVPSQNTSSSSLVCRSPVLRSDSELTRSSPGDLAPPFWGPGLSPPPQQTSADTELPCGNDSHPQAAGLSLFARVHQLCSGQRNLRSEGRIKKNAALSSSSKLWSFNTSLPEGVLTSLFYKRLCWQLGRDNAIESLIADALQASSTDRPQEHIRHVLDPSTRIRGFLGACYWCSAPSNDADSTETLDFKLAHPFCVVREIVLQPYRAAFQPGSPVYPPKQVRFHFASSLQDLASANQPHSRCTTTPQYPVENSDQEQHFELPDTVCAGGYFRVELIGRVQRQQEDNRYYTCILYIMVRGTPVYGVIPSDTAPHPTLTPTSTPAPLGHQLSPVVSPHSSQTHLNLPGQDNADSEVQQVSKGVCEDAQRAEDARQGFSSQQPPVVLKAVLEDPLQAAGWLHTVSEMGKLLTLAADTNDEGDESDEDDDILHGDSDDGDFAQEQLEDDLNGHGGLGNFPDGVGLQIGEMLAHMPLGEILGAAPMDGSSDDEHMADYPLIYD